jgi:hypothetical protein
LDSPEAQDEYLRNLSDVLISKLLPAEDFSCDVLRYLTYVSNLIFSREIVTNIVFKYLIETLSRPEYIYSSIIKSCATPPPQEEDEDEVESPLMNTPLDESIPLQSIFKQEHKTFVMKKRKTTLSESSRPRSGVTIKPVKLNTTDGFVAKLQSFWAWCISPPTSIESRYRDVYLDEGLFNLGRELLDGNYWVSHYYH